MQKELDKVVYQKIARKDLTLGCKVIPMGESEAMNFCWWDENGNMIVTYDQELETHSLFLKEIIGHPILLSDVLHFLYNEVTLSMSFLKRSFVTEKVNVTIDIWNLAYPHYEEQSEECKKHIRNFF